MRVPFATDLRRIVKGRDFRRLFATRVTSALSDGVFQVGLAGYVLFSPEQQATASDAAATAAVLLLPYSALGPFAGVFIDRWRRRQILVVAPVVRALAVLATAGLLASGNDGVPFYLAALVVFGVNRFFLSALSAALPRVVGSPELLTANAVSVTSGTMAAFAGGGVGYLLRLLFGADRYGTAVMLCCGAGMYLAASLIATTIRRDRLGPDVRAGSPARAAVGEVLRGLADGGRYVWRHRPALAALGAIGLQRLLYGVTLIMTVLLYRNYFNRSAEAGLGGVAVVLGVSGVGYFVAAVLTPIVTARISKRVWITGQLVFGAVAELVFVAPFAQVPYVAGAFLLGVVSQGVKLCVDNIVQSTIDDVYRGRVFSIYDMLFNGTFVAGFAVAAVLLPANGRSYGVLFLICGGYLVTAIGYWYVSQRAGGGLGGTDHGGGDAGDVGGRHDVRRHGVDQVAERAEPDAV